MVKFVKNDLEFIIEQISISEQHAALSQGATLEESREILLSLLPNSQIFFGMRTVDGSLNNLVAGQENFGAANGAGGGGAVEFPRLVRESYRGTDPNEDPFPLGPGGPFVTNTDYQESGDVVDSDPRIISNLIVDQTANNPAAVDAAIDNGGASIISSPGLDGIFGTADDVDVYEIPNVAPDFGLTAPFNGFMTFFGQFFDHGLDLINKGGSGTIYIPLQPDDPLFSTDVGALNFMVVTRASVDPGPDGLLGTDDDVTDPVNAITPFVDQNQTYTSHPAVQVFVRAYEPGGTGGAVATGRLLENRDIGGDGEFGTGDDVEIGGMSTWGTLKAQARDILGIDLDDLDALDMPLIATDQYGNFSPGVNGFPQIVTTTGLVEGNLAAPIDASDAIRTGSTLLLDIAHNAAPVTDGAGNLVPDSDGLGVGGIDIAGNAVANDGMGHNTEYDDELFDQHFVAGDGRVNENIVLTSVHHVFHSEHNRLVEHTKAVLLGIDESQDATIVASQNTDIMHSPVALLNEYLLVDVTEIPTLQADIDALVWDGERLFQTAKFGTEMQYQHLVFEEFARKVQPLVNVFGSYDTTIDPSISMVFSQAVYRFGHSMLTETVDRFDTDFNVVDDGILNDGEQLGLIRAFLNPLEFDNQDTQTPEEAAGSIIRGMTRVVGNNIDEFVTEALRNNLVGLPLDLAAINIARARDVGIPTFQEVRAEFFRGTSDPKLKPYDSWVDFAQNVKHEASVINFIAAYGTHDAITLATTLDDKRDAALDLVIGDGDDADGVTIGGINYTDRLDFLNSTGDWANDAGNPVDLDGVTTTGLGNVDLWIGGLAEQIEFFGGMLGSTFAFVFENQLENLQDGDRFYYLARTAGLNFLTQLEQNSFAELIQRNTDATHLPGDVFSTPDFILEVDQTQQFNEGQDDIVIDSVTITAGADPTGNSIFFPLVERDDPNQNLADIADEHYLKYQRTGGANGIAHHVVVGGTEFNDTIFTSTEDDTLWGDDGDDYLNSGTGADVIFGGAGDDILITLGGPGPSNLQGQDGNDVIAAGPGEALILAGAGKDFVLAGADLKETFGGAGNDFIDAGDDANIVFAGEGDDWIESGDGNDLLQGDNGNPFQTSTIIGNDVLISNGGDNDHDAESGDDIMVNGAGTDRFEGMLGFDWVTHKNDPNGIEADMLLRAVFEAPLPPSNQAILDRYDLVEGLSGSAFADILRADNEDALTMATGENGLDHILRNFDLIEGLRGGDNSFNLFDNSVTEWGEGNIVLGGDGSDIIEGRGGNDIIDGDLWLNVRISIRMSEDPDSTELATVDGMKEVVEAGPGVPAEWVGRALSDMMLDRTINPGQLHITREILDSKDTHNTNVNGNEGDFDTAVFSDVFDNYDIEGGGVDMDGDGFITVTHNVPAGGGGGGGGLGDGTDLLRNIERLQFSDASIDLVAGLNQGPVGNIEISGTNPDGSVDVGMTLTAGVTDFGDDGVPGGNGPNADSGYVTDLDNTLTGGLITGPVSYIWQVEQTPGEGDFIDLINEQGILGEPVPVAGATFTVTGDVGGGGVALRVRGIYQDQNGVLETAFSLPTGAVNGGIPIGAVTTPTNGADILVGTNPAGETLEGLAGDDEIFGLAGNDILIGGDSAAIVNPPGQPNLTAPVSNNAGNDILDGGAGMDTAVFFGLQDDFLFAITPQGTLEVVIVNPAVGTVGEEDELINIEVLEFRDPITNILSTSLTIGQAFALADIVGTPLDDNGIVNPILNGTAGDDVIDGLAGNDILNGLGGNDELIGGLGDDELNGGPGNDILDGGDGMDLLNGGSGNDDLAGGAGDDTLNGGIGADILDGGADNDILSGGAGNDELAGGTGNDTLNGGAGNDILDGGDGADILSGGLGDDTIDAGANDDTIIWNVGDGRDFIDGNNGTDQMVINGSAGGEIFFVETVADFEQRLLDNGLANPVPALDGGTEIVVSRGLAGVLGATTIITELTDIENITVNGGGGSDTLIVSGDFTGTALLLATITFNGSGDNDTVDISGLVSDHRVVFNSNGGIDQFIGMRAQDEINAPGSDIIDNGDGTISIIGSEVTTITGTPDDDNLTGTPGADIINGLAGNDIIDGLAGNDVLTGGLGDDDIFAGDGDDTIIWTATDTTEDGWDIIDGGTGTDDIRITGSDADEIFYIETVAVFPSSPGSPASPTTEIVISREVVGSGFSDIIAELENVEEIRIDGKGGNNTFIVDGNFGATSLNLNTIILDGSSGDNTYDISGLTSEHRIIINTMGGNDEVIGDLRPQDIVILAPDTTSGDYTSTDNGDGTTTLSDGTNSITFSTLSTPIIEDGPQSNPSSNRIPLVAASVVLAALVQDTQLTLTAAELLGTMGEITDPDGDPLTVQNVQASSGSITDNGDGTWTFTPDAGDDTDVSFTYDVTDGLSAPVSAMAELDLLPNAGTPQPNAHPGGTAGDDILLGKPGDDIIDAQGGNDRVFAGEGNDIVFGGDGADQLFGEAGNDIIFGGQGDDSLFGGTGKDILFGDEGDDIIIGGLGNDVLLGGTGADTILGDVGNDIILGGAGNDLLLGQDGDDIIDGGAGEDQVHGGAGRDLLLGGQDDDTFVFNTAAEAGNGALADVIADFQVGDKIDLSGIDANLGVGGNQGFDPIMFDATFTDAGQIMFRHEQRSDGVHTILEGDVDGDNTADFRIDIVGQHNLTSSDFLGVA